jgi:hypothetical protein
VEAVITVKVWQLMLLGLGVVVAAAALLTMVHRSATTTVAPSPGIQPVQQAQITQLVNAVPTVTAFFAKHKSYVHLALAPSTGVSVQSATPTSFCIETTGPAPHVFKSGPTGRLMLGTCAQAATGTPLG